MLKTLLHEWLTLGEPAFVDEYVCRFQALDSCAVCCAGSLEGVAEEVIQREIDFHQRLEQDFEWTVYGSDQPSDMLDRLERFGFEIGTKEVVCGLDLTSFSPPTPSGIRVERIKSPAMLADFRTVAEAVFSKDFSYTTGILAECLAKASTRQTGFISYDGDTPVSIGRLDKVDGGICAGLYTGGTLKEYRGKGFYRALVWERIRYAQELGAKIAWVDAKPTSLPILMRLGFEPLVETWPCEKRF